MPTKSCRVRAAITVCDLWYLLRNRDIRSLNERIEAFWIEVEFHVDAMEQAEREGNEYQAARHLDKALQYLERIEAEARIVRAQNSARL